MDQATAFRIWARSEESLCELLAEIALELTNDEDDGRALFDAVQYHGDHERKDEFLNVAYPILKAYQALQAASSLEQPVATRH